MGNNSSLLFFLTKKVTKKSRQFDAEKSFNLKISYDELPGGKVIWMEGLKVEDSASCYYRFRGGAVFFTVSFILTRSIPSSEK